MAKRKGKQRKMWNNKNSKRQNCCCFLEETPILYSVFVSLCTIPLPIIAIFTISELYVIKRFKFYVKYNIYNYKM